MRNAALVRELLGAAIVFGSFLLVCALCAMVAVARAMGEVARGDGGHWDVEGKREMSWQPQGESATKAGRPADEGFDIYRSEER